MNLDTVQFIFIIITVIAALLAVYFISKTKKFEDSGSHLAMLILMAGLVAFAIAMIGHAITHLYPENGLITQIASSEYMTLSLMSATWLLAAAFMFKRLSRVFRFMK